MRAIAVLLTVLFACCVYAEPKRPCTTHTVFFEGTDYELSVYEIFGRRDGKTIFMLGGIQGDEPGGYLSADLYANLALEQGNLIVIPRANLKSVILFDRGPEGDMNRLFVGGLDDKRLDYEVVKVIMEYMGKADMFLNLHDGWGYYSPVHVNEQRNPKRFGQSIIVDEDVFVCEDSTELPLESMAKEVLEGVNGRIQDKNHHLAYFNTRTGQPDSQYKSMQKTATWYALRNYCIPAFGVESSKNIKSVELKVLYHNYAVNEFMRIMDIIPENPPILTSPAMLDHVLVTVNGESMYVSNGDTIEVDKYDKVAVNHIEANYTRGVSCDMLGYGNLNDLKKEFAVAYTTKIVFRKEDAKFAEITVKVKPETAVTQISAVPSGYQLEVLFNGEIKYIAQAASLQLKKGESFTINRLLYNGRDTLLPVNLRGWVPSTIAENKADDRGYSITVSDETMIKRYSTGGRGETYPITVDQAGKEIMRAYIKIK